MLEALWREPAQLPALDIDQFAFDESLVRFQPRAEEVEVVRDIVILGLGLVVAVMRSLPGPAFFPLPSFPTAHSVKRTPAWRERRSSPRGGFYLRTPTRASSQDS